MSALLPSTLGLLEVRLSMSPQQSAWLIGWGALCSGLAQPICAALSDRFSTRFLGVVGVVLGAMGIGSLGLAEEVVTLTITYTVGMIGVGMFHPFGAATIGELRQHRRTSAVSLFFVSGMVGGVVGAYLWPRVLATAHGFQWLPLSMVPMLLLVFYLLRHLGELARPHASAAKIECASRPRVDWFMVLVLYIAASVRFCVNTALVYLYVRLAEVYVVAAFPSWSKEQVANGAAPMVGNFQGATLMGMALGGLLAGIYVRPGREKWPLVFVPLCFSPILWLLPLAPVQIGYGLAMAAGIGFASMIPVTIALAQYLMPRQTNLASGLMMGGAWSVAMIGPRCAEYGVTHFGIHATFALTAVALALSGLLCIPLSNRT